MSKGKLSILRWLHRYVSVPLVAVVAFLAYVLFFNEHSMMRSLELNQEIDRLTAEIKANQDTCDHYLRMNRSLQTDPATMERVMRERYHYQKANEDLYIIEKD